MKVLLKPFLLIAILFGIAVSCNNSALSDEINKPDASVTFSDNETILLDLSEHERYYLDQFNNYKDYAKTKYTTARLPLSDYEFEGVLDALPSLPNYSSSDIFATVIFFDRNSDFEPIDLALRELLTIM